MRRRILKRLTDSYGSEQPTGWTMPPCLGTVLAGFAVYLLGSGDYRPFHHDPTVVVLYVYVLLPSTALWLSADAVRCWRSGDLAMLALNAFGWLLLSFAISLYFFEGQPR